MKINTNKKGGGEKSIVVAFRATSKNVSNKDAITELVNYAKSNTLGIYKEIKIGFVANELAQKILQETEVKLNGIEKIVSADDIGHAIKRHRNSPEDAIRNQMDVEDNDFCFIDEILKNPDEVQRANDHKNGDKALKFIKTNGKKEYTLVAVLSSSKAKPKLYFRTLYIKKLV